MSKDRPESEIRGESIVPAFGPINEEVEKHTANFLAGGLADQETVTIVIASTVRAQNASSALREAEAELKSAQALKLREEVRELALANDAAVMDRSGGRFNRLLARGIGIYGSLLSTVAMSWDVYRHATGAITLSGFPWWITSIGVFLGIAMVPNAVALIASRRFSKK